MCINLSIFHLQDEFYFRNFYQVFSNILFYNADEFFVIFSINFLIDSKKIISKAKKNQN